jgi:DNA-binding transcriptional MerR regulator
MTAANDRPVGRKLPTRLMCERYGVVDRTINRWEKAGVIPQAERINGRKYWDREKVEKRDHERMLAQTGKGGNELKERGHED